MSALADTLRLRVLDRRRRRVLVIVLALRAWQWFARPISFWNYVPGTSGTLYGYTWVTDANSAAFLLVPLLVYACSGHLEGLLDAHRLVRMRSRGWAALDFLGIAAGRALALSAVALASGLVIVVPQIPAETVTPQLALAFLGILARHVLFFLVCAALMLAAYVLTSLVPAAVVAALSYGAVGFLLQGRITDSTLLDRWGWLCALPPHNVPDTADALACMAKYAVAIVALAVVAALALRRRDVLGEGGGGPGEKDARGERRLVLWLPLRRRYLGRVGACVGAAALVAFLLSRGNPTYALARLHAGEIFLPNDLGIDLFGTVGALLPSLALAWLLASFLTSDLTHASLLWPRLSFGDSPQMTDARTRWALIRTGQLTLLAGAYGALAPTVAAAACLPGSGDALEDVASALAQALPFSVAGSVLLVLLVNLLALRLDAVMAWAIVAVTHATSLVACVFLPESAVAALTPWLPSAAATAAFHAAPIGASTPLSLAHLLLLVFLASALIVREARRSTSSEVTAMTDPTITTAGTDNIVISHATKVIRRRTVLDDVSLELPRGGIYGFSGINGSGKTMLFRAIAGLIHLTSGTIDVFGRRIGRDASFPAGLGLILESVGFWEEYTGLDNLRLLASIRGSIGEREIRAALERVGLNPDDGREYGAYSLGMKQRLAVAQAVMEAPELLVLDEPTNALDVDGIALVCRIIREERERGATVLLACHNEPDLEALFERRFHMADGRIVREG